MSKFNNIVPIFSTAASLRQGGIFTVEKAGEKNKVGKKLGPTSLCDLAKQESLKTLFIADSNLINFMPAHKNLSSIGCNVHFGLKLVICEDMNDKSESSFKTESKIIIWPQKDTVEVYSKLIKIYSKSSTDGFYYIPRLDWKTLKSLWSDDLTLSLPFYSSFLARNTLTFSSIIPDLPVEPMIFKEIGQNMPFDNILSDSIEKYAKSNNLDIQNVKSIYYEKYSDARAFLVWRCILERKTYDKPNMDYMYSRDFSWENFKNLQ